MIVRAATVTDRPGIAAVGEACDLDLLESARDSRYLGHLLACGSVVVAEEGEVVGFAASTVIDGVTMLCDLFVRPDSRSHGVGDALLASILGDGPRMTFSSKDSRALALYLRHGMRPRWPLLYLSGAPASDSPLAVDIVDAGQAAVTEADLTGIARADSYAYWASRPTATAFVLRGKGSPVAAGCVTATELTHLSIAPDSDPVAAVTAALTLIQGRASLCVPGHLPVAGTLLSAGFRIDDFDTFFTSGHDPTDAGLVVAAPGLV